MHIHTCACTRICTYNQMKETLVLSKAREFIYSNHDKAKLMFSTGDTIISDATYGQVF